MTKKNGKLYPLLGSLSTLLPLFYSLVSLFKLGFKFFLMVLFLWLVCSIVSLFWLLGKVLQSKEVVQAAKIDKLGSKFNIHIDDTFERIKLATNETINKSMVVALTKGITQENVRFFLSEERFMLSKEKCY